jgi:hypothetical protein
MTNDTLMLIRIAGGVLLGVSLAGALGIWILGKRLELQPLYKLAGSSQGISQAILSFLFIFAGDLGGDAVTTLLTVAGCCTLIAFILAATQIYVESIVG